MTPLFIHGAGASPNVWRLQLLHFKQSMAIELPGHPTGSSYSTIDEYSSTVEEYAKKNRLKDPVLVGHSMGGAIAITLALRHMEMAGIVLVGTGARLRVNPTFKKMIRENYEEASRMIAEWSVSPSSDPIIAERIAKEMLKVNPEVTFGDFIACDGFDLMSEVKNIACKTLIVCGADDRMTPPKYSQYLHEKIPGSKLVLIPNAGHSVMLEQHRQFNEALENFLGSL